MYLRDKFPRGKDLNYFIAAIVSIVVVTIATIFVVAFWKPDADPNGKTTSDLLTTIVSTITTTESPTTTVT
ncbi:hypothetical protein SNEBB_004969 [Seison nebaliae]|nr:hypothetical protein SNEBB_004969 [Seison nebaliae]